MGENIFNASFEVIWKDLCYRSYLKGNTKKIILDRISGSFKSGQLFAIMGPSGCGKSSLLACLTAIKTRGVSGSITISVKRKIKLNFIPQEDYLQNDLTVYELLLYASKLQNNIDHISNVVRISHLLNIDNFIDVRTKNCSGGQRKRISIALELVSRPDILVLDEPTTGLDSLTTWQLINNLLELSQLSPPMAIVLTIHQPSTRLFYLFSSVYIMSYDGQCIYQGTPQTIINYLDRYGLKCPEFNTPQDFALEVASKDHGIAKVMLLTSIKKMEDSDLIPHQYKIEGNHTNRTIIDVWILFLRLLKQSIRNLWDIPLRIAVYIANAIFPLLLFDSNSGHITGCPEEFAVSGDTYFDNFQKVSEKLQQNITIILLIIINVWFGGILSVLLTFPKEMNIIQKENRNGCYSCLSYYLATLILDTLLQITLPNITVIPVYILTGQNWDQNWRLYYFILINILVALNSSSMGQIISAFFMKTPTAAVFIGLMSSFPFLLLSGFLITVKDMPKVFQWLTNLNYLRLGLEASLVDIYGFDRCMGQSLLQNNTALISEEKIQRIKNSDKFNGTALVNILSVFSGRESTDRKPLIMKQMNFEDNDLYYCIEMLCVLMISFKVMAFLILLRKIKSNN